VKRKIVGFLVSAAALAGAGCKPENNLTPMIDGSIAITAGDFDDVQQPFNRMVVNTEGYEGLISSATWDDDYNPANNSLKVEDLIGLGNDIVEHQLVLFASGTRGMGKRQYNGLQPDDQFVADPNVASQLQAKVGGMGVLVMTDWAYDLAEQAYPDYVEYLGDDTDYDAAQTGEIGNVTATVTDERLAEAIGAETAVLRYDFSNWAVIEGVDEDKVTVWMRGDVTYRVRDGEGGTQSLTDVPLLVSYQPEGLEKGSVVVSTFHFDAQTPELTDQILRVVVGNFEEQAYAPVDPL
jgi:hypothetical protein